MIKKFICFLSVVLLFSCSSDDNLIKTTSENKESIENTKPILNGEDSNQDDKNDFINSENLNIIKSLTEEYYNQTSMSIQGGNSGILNEDYIKLYNNSIDFLINEGGFTSEDVAGLFIEEYDQRVIITAMAISEYNKYYVNGDEYVTASSGVGNCVLEAVGINALVNGAGKKIATKVLSRFVPYVGWGLAAVDFADCMDWF